MLGMMAGPPWRAKGRLKDAATLATIVTRLVKNRCAGQAVLACGRQVTTHRTPPGAVRAGSLTRLAAKLKNLDKPLA